MSRLRSNRSDAVLLAAALLPALSWPGLLADEKKASPTVACRDLASAVKQMAAEAAKFTTAEGGQSLVVNSFSGPPGAKGGAIIAQDIQANLPKALLARPGAGAMGLIGHYRLKKDKASGAMSVIIEAQITDSLGEPLKGLTPCLLRDAGSLKTLSK